MGDAIVQYPSDCEGSIGSSHCAHHWASFNDTSSKHEHVPQDLMIEDEVCQDNQASLDTGGYTLPEWQHAKATDNEWTLVVESANFDQSCEEEQPQEEQPMAQR